MPRAFVSLRSFITLESSYWSIACSYVPFFVSPQRRQPHFSWKQLHFLFCGWGSLHTDLLMLPLKSVINSMVLDNHVFFQRYRRSRRRLLPLFLLLQDFYFISGWKFLQDKYIMHLLSLVLGKWCQLSFLKVAWLGVKDLHIRTMQSWTQSQLCLNELCYFEEAS